MRRRSLGLLLALVMTLAGCTNDAGEGAVVTEPPTTPTTVASTQPPPSTTVVPSSTTTSDPSPDKPYGGEAIAAATQEPTTLNGFLPGGVSSVGQTINQSYASGVYDIDASTLELIPELVTELPTIANGGVSLNDDGSMTVSYRIREDAVWDDGTPISGEDFQFTLDVILDPDIPTAKTTYEDIVSSDYGPKEFTYTLRRPTMAHELLFSEIIPKHAVEGTDFVADWNDERWPSSGPFRLEEWAKGESLTVVRNPSYWKRDAVTDQQLPFLDSVTWSFIPDAAEAIEAFRTREVDIVEPPPDPASIEALKALEGEGARTEVRAGSSWEQVSFQFGPGRLDRNPNSCGDQIDLRRAVALAIDRRALTRAMLGDDSTAMDSYVDAYLPDLSTGAWNRYPFDPVEAERSYLKAVEATGRECSVAFTSDSGNDERVELSRVLADMLGAANIPFDSRLEDGMTFFTTTLDEGRWDLAEWPWVASPGLAALIEFQGFYDPAGEPPDGSNLARWGTTDSSVRDESTERFAEVQEELRTTVDRGRLAELLEESEQILAEEVVFIPLYAHPVIASVWADEVAGFAPNPSVARYTWNIETWYRSDR